MANQMGEFAREILENLQKALDSGGALPLIKEDLEPEAHNSLYATSSPNELRLLKCLARGRATSIKHEFDLINNYSGNTSSGFFGEKSLPGLFGVTRTLRHTKSFEIDEKIRILRIFSEVVVEIVPICASHRKGYGEVRGVSLRHERAIRNLRRQG